MHVRLHNNVEVLSGTGGAKPDFVRAAHLFSVFFFFSALASNVHSARPTKKRFRIETRTGLRFEMHATVPLDGRTFRLSGSEVKEKGLRRTDQRRTKTFKITHQTNTRDQPGGIVWTARWIRQRNGYDCGPLMLLNSLGLMGIRAPHGTVAEVRGWLSAFPGRGRDLHHRRQWLNANEIAAYLGHVGLQAQNIAMISAFEVGRVLEKVGNGFRMLYMTAGRHFRAILATDRPGEYVLVDPSAGAPELIDSARMLELVWQNDHVRPDGTPEVVGFVE